MIKYLMRRNIYKNYDKETQDRLLQLNSKQFIIKLLFNFIIFPLAFIFPFIPVFIIDVCEKNIELSITTQLVIAGFMLICFLGFIIFNKTFIVAVIVFSQLVTEKIHFLLCTKKGKAICKKDFKIIQEKNKKLYECIEQQVYGYCYKVCFDVCKTLKKGSLEFLAVKEISLLDDEKNNEKKFTMHVVYVNNGWAFDPDCFLQYPIEKLKEIYKAKVYKTFTFEEISNKSYEEFREEQGPEAEKWAINNDCSIFWLKKET